MVNPASDKLPLLAGVSPGDMLVVFIDRVGFVFETPLGVSRVFEVLEILQLPRTVPVLDLWESIRRGCGQLLMFC
jgi:hypothetical protein